jgi:tRNA G26 N,N-dimethylase Trm1
MLDLRQLYLLDRDLVWSVIVECLHLGFGRHLVLLLWSCGFLGYSLVCDTMSASGIHARKIRIEKKGDSDVVMDIL